MEGSSAGPRNNGAALHSLLSGGVGENSVERIGERVVEAARGAGLLAGRLEAHAARRVGRLRGGARIEARGAQGGGHRGRHGVGRAGAGGGGGALVLAAARLLGHGVAQDLVQRVDDDVVVLRGGENAEGEGTVRWRGCARRAGARNRGARSGRAARRTDAVDEAELWAASAILRDASEWASEPSGLATPERRSGLPPLPLPSERGGGKGAAGGGGPARPPPSRCACAAA